MKHYDLIVAGGGLTGVCAAVRAAREGLSVLLVEKGGTLGGALTNNLVYPFMNYVTNVDGKEKTLCAGLFAEMRERERAYDASGTMEKFRPEYFKMVLDDMVSEAGVDVLVAGNTVFKADDREAMIHALKSL